MRYPDSLPAGGTIGCIAPSFGCNIEPYRSAFDNALKTWQQMGYHTVLGPNCYEGSGIGISNTPEKCGAEVNHFFAEENCDIILSCGGGELMCEVVSHIDFERIARAKAKWYMGFSDNTNLTFLLPTLCDTAAIYGPCAPAFGMREWHPALKDAWGLLSGRITEVHGYPLWERESLKDEEHPLEPYNVTEEKKLVIYDETGRRIDGEKRKKRRNSLSLWQKRPKSRAKRAKKQSRRTIAWASLPEKRKNLRKKRQTVKKVRKSNCPKRDFRLSYIQSILPCFNGKS